MTFSVTWALGNNFDNTRQRSGDYHLLNVTDYGGNGWIGLYRDPPGSYPDPYAYFTSRPVLSTDVLVAERLWIPAGLQTANYGWRAYAADATLLIGSGAFGVLANDYPVKVAALGVSGVNFKAAGTASFTWSGIPDPTLQDAVQIADAADMRTPYLGKIVPTAGASGSLEIVITTDIPLNRPVAAVYLSGKQGTRLATSAAFYRVP